MKAEISFPFWRRGVFRQLLFLASFTWALLSLVLAPVFGAAQQWEQARTIQFQGHQVSVATKADIGRAGTPKGPPGLSDPVPIPGGLVLPPQIHVFAPGPVNEGFQGVDVEPSVLTNYRGFSAIGYPGGFGTATDSNGTSYDVV